MLHKKNFLVGPGSNGCGSHTPLLQRIVPVSAFDRKLDASVWGDRGGEGVSDSKAGTGKDADELRIETEKVAMSAKTYAGHPSSCSPWTRTWDRPNLLLGVKHAD